MAKKLDIDYNKLTLEDLYEAYDLYGTEVEINNGKITKITRKGEEV